MAQVIAKANTVKTGMPKPIIPDLKTNEPAKSRLTPISTTTSSTPGFSQIPNLQTIPQMSTLTPKEPQNNTQFDFEALLASMQKQNQSFLDAQNQQQSAIEARINALNQAKQTQAVANLGKARDTQLSNLTGEEAGIKPMYYDKRNASAATNMIGRRSLAEELAARGETRSGVADQANISANMSLQGETGLLNRQEAADITDIARRRTGVQNSYESDVVSAKAGFEANAMQNLIDQYNADRQFKLQEAGTTGTYNGNQTMAAQGQTFNQNMATQQFDQVKSQQEIDNTYRQTQTSIENALSNRQITNQEAQQLLDNAYRSKTLAEQKRQFNVGQSNYQQQVTQDQKQQKLDNLYRQQTFDYQKSKDAVSNSQWQQNMNLDLRQMTNQEAQQKIENSFAKGQMARADADQALQWAQFNADNDPNSLDNQIKKSQIDQIQGKGGLVYKDYVSMGRDMLDKGNYDSSAGTYNKMYNSSDVLNWLKGLPLTSTEKAQLANDLGL